MFGVFLDLLQMAQAMVVQLEWDVVKADSNYLAVGFQECLLQDLVQQLIQLQAIDKSEEYMFPESMQQSLAAVEWELAMEEV